MPRGDRGWLAALDAYLQKADDERLGWCYWAGGEWWGEGYLLSVQPGKTKGLAVEQWEDRPQMGVLRKHLAAQDREAK